MRTNKFWKLFVATLLVTCVLVASSVHAFADTVRLPKGSGQNKNNWCWATSAKLVGVKNGGNNLSTGAAVATDTANLHSFGGTLYYGQDSAGRVTLDAGQREIVMYVKGSDRDASGDDSSKESALKRAARSAMTTATVGTSSSNLTSEQVTLFNAELAADRWCLGNLVSGSFAHSLAVKAYSSTSGYQILDPWDLTDMYYSSNILTSASFPSAGYNCTLRWYQSCKAGN